MTYFKDIIDRAYVSYMKDYHLDNLLRTDESAFYEYLSTFLINASDEFATNCFNDLSYSYYKVLNEETMEEHYVYAFNSDLSSNEIRILSLMIAINWYKKEIDDVVVFKPHLQNKQFKGLAGDQNIAKRMDRLCELKEELSDNIVSYQIGGINSNGMDFFNGGV